MKKSPEKKLSHMRIFQNILFIVFIVVLATHNFALRREIDEKEQDITMRELELRTHVRELRSEQNKWRQGYEDFQIRKVQECKKLQLEEEQQKQESENAAEPADNETGH